MRAIAAFSWNDLANIRRDSLLLYIAVIPWVMVLLLRLLIPVAAAWLYERYAIELAAYYPLVLSFLLIQMPMMFGVITGLLVLDERDADTLTVLRVTPLPMWSYAGYRLATAVLFSVVYLVILLPLTGMVRLAQMPALVPSLLLAGLLAPVLAMLLAAFAGNKLEGLALMKGSGILLLGPLAAYFVSAEWQLLLGLLPTYWPARAFWAASAGEPAWPYLLVGVIYNGALLAWLVRRFQQRLARA